MGKMYFKESGTLVTNSLFPRLSKLLGPRVKCVFCISPQACTGGGCTVSEASEALTDEQAPEGVPTPKAHSYSPHSFHISWTEPEYPNGK